VSLWKETLRRAAYLGRRRRFEEELDAEVRFHIETRVEELQQSGLPRHTAQAQAQREFGPAALMFEATRAPWRFQWLEDVGADLRYAARAFRRNPAFALTAIACLALGVGANTTIFSLATEVLFSQPSVRSPRTLLHLQIGGSSHAPMREYRFLRDARIFEGLAGEHEESEVNWRHGDATSRLFAVRVTDNFFDVTGMPLAMGRPIQPARSDGGPDTVVLTHHLWQQLGGDPNIMGRKLQLDGRLYTVSGVLPAGHRTLMGFGFSPDLYVPVPHEQATAGMGQIVALYARIPQGMTRQAAYARLLATCQELDRVYPDGDRKWGKDIGISAVSGFDHLASERELMPVAAFFAMLMIVVGLVLLIACANVASLLLARASSRSHELAIRLSIGASRGRIVRQLLSESLLLALCGTAAGLALNIGVTAMLSRVRLPLPIPIQFAIQPDWRLLSYAVAVSLVSALASGLMPAIKGTRTGIGAALKQDQGQVGRARWTLRNVLVAGQIAVSIVLLCAGFLFMRNLLQASAMNPGFDLGHTIWAYMRLVPEAYPKPAQTRALIDAAIERLRSLPGVEAAAIAKVVPLNDANTMGTGIGTDLVAKPVQVQFNNNYVGPGYFKTMAIAILSGREFLPSDRQGAPRVAILNENMAKRLFGSINPVGHTVVFEEGHPILIAGVASNSKYFTLGEENALAYYEPYAQWGGSVVNLHFMVRASGSGSPQALVPAIRSALGQLDRTAALEINPMRNALAFAMLPSQVGAAILGAMGLLGLLLASIGLYGTLLYAVSRRIREIGLRVALGASPASIMSMVLRQSLALVAAGVAIGIALAIFAVRPLAMFLVPEVRTSDATNFVVVAAVLGAVALAATAAPALRALRVDPVVALRHE
jgi:predicted permease